jgi:hypothetical protein
MVADPNPSGAANGKVSEIPVQSGALKMLVDVFRSGRPLVYIRSAEERRVGNLLREVGGQLLSSTPLPVWTWSLTEGMCREDQQTGAATRSSRDGAQAREPLAALDFIAAHSEPAIFHLKDFHEPLRESPDVRRRLRDLYEICMDRQKFVAISSPVRFIPVELERDLMVIDLRLPEIVELMEFLREQGAGLPVPGADGETGDGEEILYRMARALQGLTIDEAHHAVRRARAERDTLGLESLPALLEEKRLLINRGGVIEFITDGTDMGAVGGLENLKKWLMERRKLFQTVDSDSADIVPKGVLVMGIPGCGKSLSVKAIASCFELPLYRIDMIEIFSGRHGKPEEAFVDACRTMESLAPAVVWFDEIEMGISSTNSAGEQGRIFAFFLTWMQEKGPGLFIAATANRIDLLPAEMIRKGRFDEVFFVDLPHKEEQLAIFKIHLGRRGVDAAKFNFEEVIRFTRDWTGAEIEQCVISALTRARLAEREVTESDLVSAAVEGVALARSMREQVSQIRQWAFERAVRASPVPAGR